MTKKILIGHPHYCAILNQKTVSGSQFYAEYIYNAFALRRHVIFKLQLQKNIPVECLYYLLIIVTISNFIDTQRHIVISEQIIIKYC